MDCGSNFWGSWLYGALYRFLGALENVLDSKKMCKVSGSSPTAQRVREVSSRGFRIDFASLRVVSYSGHSLPVVLPRSDAGGTGGLGGLDTPLGP